MQETIFRKTTGRSARRTMMDIPLAGTIHFDHRCINRRLQQERQDQLYRKMPDRL